MGRSPVAGRTRNEASGKNWPQPGKQHDVAQKSQAACFAAILIVDLAVHMVRVRELDQARGRIERAVGPRLDSQARRRRLAGELCFIER